MGFCLTWEIKLAIHLTITSRKSFSGLRELETHAGESSLLGAAEPCDAPASLATDPGCSPAPVLLPFGNQLRSDFMPPPNLVQKLAS